MGASSIEESSPQSRRTQPGKLNLLQERGACVSDININYQSNTEYTSMLTDSEEPEVASVPDTDFDCNLCYCLLYDPVSIPCGHTFCRKCLAQALNSKPNCPMCRTPCSADVESLPGNSLLQTVLSTRYAAKYKKRKSENFMELKRRSHTYPVFVTSFNVFPGQKPQFHIFEPRYRIMVNRALTGDRKFVVATFQQAHRQISSLQQRVSAVGGGGGVAMEEDDAAIVVGDDMNIDVKQQAVLQQQQQQRRAPRLILETGDVGCLVRILDCQVHADGRSFIRVEGVQRTRLSRVSVDTSAFGLVIADTSPVVDQDQCDEDDDGDLSSSCSSVDEVDSHGYSLRSRGRNCNDLDSKGVSGKENDSISEKVLTEGLLAAFDKYLRVSGTTKARVAHTHGNPPSEGGDALVFWLCAVLTGEAVLKERILRSEQRRERLELASELLQQCAKNAKSKAKTQSYAIVFVLLFLALLHYTTE